MIQMIFPECAAEGFPFEGWGPGVQDATKSGCVYVRQAFATRSRALCLQLLAGQAGPRPPARLTNAPRCSGRSNSGQGPVCGYPRDPARAAPPGE